MKLARLFAPCVVAALAAAGSSRAADCPNAQMFLMPASVNEPAQVGMVGHVDNGTVVDGGSFRAEITVDQTLYDALSTSLAAGCSQFVHQVSSGNVVLLGIASGSYAASTEVVAERPGLSLRRRLAPVMRDRAAGATNGVVDHAHDPRLKRALMSQLQIGDVIALNGTATATGTIVDGWVFDQVQVLYGWSNLTPWLEVRLP